MSSNFQTEAVPKTENVLPPLVFNLRGSKSNQSVNLSSLVGGWVGVGVKL